jgi:hypothetical protein
VRAVAQRADHKAKAAGKAHPAFARFLAKYGDEFEENISAAFRRLKDLEEAATVRKAREVDLEFELRRLRYQVKEARNAKAGPFMLTLVDPGLTLRDFSINFTNFAFTLLCFPTLLSNFAFKLCVHFVHLAPLHQGYGVR